MVTVDSKGRIVLPSEVRDRLEVGPGSEVVVTTEDGRVVVEPEDTPEQVMRDLETLIDEAAENRERHSEPENEVEGKKSTRADPIVAKQREIIRRGATRSESDDRDEHE